MLHFGVLVFVRVPHLGRQPWMHVIVVPVVVTVGVRVLDGLVAVFVLVSPREEQAEGDHHDHRGRSLGPQDRLAK